MGLDQIALQLPGPALGHLAAAGITGAEEQDAQALAHDSLTFA